MGGEETFYRQGKPSHPPLSHPHPRGLAALLGERAAQWSPLCPGSVYRVAHYQPSRVATFPAWQNPDPTSRGTQSLSPRCHVLSYVPFRKTRLPSHLVLSALSLLSECRSKGLYSSNTQLGPISWQVTSDHTRRVEDKRERSQAGQQRNSLTNNFRKTF